MPNKQVLAFMGKQTNLEDKTLPDLVCDINIAHYHFNGPNVNAP